jgi:hypothetical protein
VSTTLTDDGGRSTLPPHDTPALFVQVPAGPGPREQHLPERPRAGDWLHLPPPESPTGPDLPRPSGTWFAAAAKQAHHADLQLHEVLRAIPAESRPAASQLEALNEALARLSLAKLRPEFREKLEQFIRLHILRASWGGLGHAPRGVTAPGRERVCRLIGMSVSAYKRCRRWWEAAGFLAIVRAGWTPAIHPGLGEHATPRARERTQAELREQGLDRNLSQAYVICVPRYPAKKAWYRRHAAVPVLSGPLTFFSHWFTSPIPSPVEIPGEDSASCCYPSAGGPRTSKGATREDGTRWPGLLGQVGERTARRLTRPYKAAGWTDDDILWALDRRPDGTAHPGTGDRVRSTAAVAWWRLAHWRRPDGTVLPSASQHRAEVAARTRDEQDRRRAEDGARAAAALRSGDTDRVTTAAARARAMLAAASEGAAKVIAAMALRRPAPEPAPAPARTADSAIAAVLARRAATPPPQPPERPADGAPAGYRATPLPGYLQDAIDQAAAAVAAAEHDRQAP